ncbi:MAG: hypothetical protein GXO94_09320 [Nitrospirae bacterium]|nr:hypothetical protein [Nitrospirota bacterium]
MKRLLIVLGIVVALTAGTSTAGLAAAQAETAGYGSAQGGDSNGCSMAGQPGHMMKCAMMMKRAMMIKMMKKVMTIQKKMLLEPAEAEKKKMIKELDAMIERLDKMMMKMHMMMKGEAGNATGECKAPEHQHRKEADKDAQ